MDDILNIVPAWQFAVFAAIFGAMWGSFANVVIVRWPREMSVVTPGSHCFSCKTPIPFYDNIPILSFLILRGRCRHCKASYSPRYMLVELSMALLSVGVVQMTLLADPASFQQGLAEYFLWFGFVFALVTIGMIDLETYLIPLHITIPGIIIGILANWFILPLGWMEPLIATVAGFAIIRLGFIEGYKLLTGKPGMGEGDAWLVAMFGAWIGYQGALFALFAGALQGLVAGVIMVVARRKDGELDGKLNEPVFEEELDEEGNPLEEPDSRFMKARIPFGPFLAIGAIEYLFIGHWLVDAYDRLLMWLMGI